MRKEKRFARGLAIGIPVFLFICMAWAFGAPSAFPAPVEDSILYSFSGGSDGGDPCGSLTLSGSTLYGMALAGGSGSGGSGCGTIFRISTGATGFQVLYTFGGGNDGCGPQGSLKLSGSTLYGMTSGGGAYDSSGGGDGTIFKMNTDGKGYQVLHSFGGANDGTFPYGDLALSGSTLYGMTSSGGPRGNGTIFKINTNGKGYKVLRSFNYARDGGLPWSSLTLSGSTLYGMTGGGGTHDSVGGYGTIFKMNTDGTGYKVLHTFSGGSDGALPQGSLALSGSTLYGMTTQGGLFYGDSGYGTIFKVNTNGAGFRALHSFGDGSDGGCPTGSLTLSGSTLYGTTERGGPGSDGTIFRINTNGTGYKVLYTFIGGSDGWWPRGSLTRSGSTLYGMTWGGGAGDEGTIVSLSLKPGAAGLIEDGKWE